MQKTNQYFFLFDCFFIAWKYNTRYPDESKSCSNINIYYFQANLCYLQGELIV